MAIINGDPGNNTLQGTNDPDTISGNGGNDTLFGLAGNDQLNGNDGDDVLNAGLGDDALNGGPGIDWASYSTAPSLVSVHLGLNGAIGFSTGGDGNDLINVDIENIQGSAFNDDLWGDTGPNFLAGFDGADQLAGNGGNDTLWGENGDDALFGEDGDDQLVGGLGNDTLVGGNGIDTIVYSSAPSAVGVNLATGAASGGDGSDTLFEIENVVGSAFNDGLFGNGGPNNLRGEGGIDSLNGRGGNDVLDGGAGTDVAQYNEAPSAVTVNLSTGSASGGDGNDTLVSIENLTGSNFNDTLTGNGSANTLTGGEGSDTLDGRGGNDVLDGGNGIDTASYANAPSAVTVDLRTTTGTATGGDGSDTLISIENVSGSAFADRLIGNDVDNVLNGGDGDDVLDGDFGADTLNGGNGFDFADYRFFNSSILASLASGTTTFPGFGGTETLISIEGLLAGGGNDTLTGDGNNNTLGGGGGSDTLFGGGGNDALIGDGGNDILDGGAGNDSLDGSDGTDTASFANAPAAVTANLGSGTATGDGSDSLTSIESLTGGNFADGLIGNSGNNVLSGGGGDDNLSGGGGSDTLIGGDGNDDLFSGTGNDILDGGTGTDEARYDRASSGVTVSLASNTSSGGGGNDSLVNIEDLFGSPFNDTLTGNGGPNALGGGEGNDTLSGGAGIDVLTGGSGNDTLDGGSESDTAVYAGARSLYTITAVPGTSSGFTISSSAEGFDTLSNVEFAQFSDQTIALSTITADTTPPTVFSFFPADEATGVNVASSIVVTFTEPVKAGTGNIVLRDANGNAVQTFAAATAPQLNFSGNALTIDPSADLAFGTGYRVDFDNGSVKDTAGNNYSGITSYNFTTAFAPDTTPPTATAFSPADESTGVAVSSNIVVTFSETVQPGAGNIVLRDANGNAVQTFAAATAPQLRYTGNTLTIDPSADLTAGAGYRLDFDNGSVKDLAGNNFAGTTSFNFSTALAADTTAPTAQSFSPADESGGVAVSNNIVVSFSEAISRGTGTIVLRNAAGMAVETWQAATAAQLSISGNTLTIDPSADLGAGAGYRIDFDFGSVKDLAGNSFAGTTTYNFNTAQGQPSDTTPPTATSFSPADEAGSVALGSNIVVSFSEAIQGGSGTINLRNASGTLIESFSAGSKNSRATISGSTLTIDPTNDLTAGTGYRVDFDFGSVKDNAGNSSASITAYNFTTAGGSVSNTPTPGDDVLTGTAGPDNINALAGKDRVNAGDGNDTIDGGPGADRIDGGAGSDTATFPLLRGDYLFSRSSKGEVTVQDKFGTLDTLVNIESVQTASGTVATSAIPYLPTYDEAAASSTLVFRFYNDRDKAFFYTASVAERNLIIQQSTDPAYTPNDPVWPYFYQGATFEQGHTSAGTSPVYRFYNTATGHHFFTTSEAERENVFRESTDPNYGAPGPLWSYNFEGVAFQAYGSPGRVDSQTVFRFYSPTLDRHFFTASADEAQEIRLTGVWNDEGVGFYGEVPG